MMLAPHRNQPVPGGPTSLPAEAEAEAEAQRTPTPTPS
jgi:hypothetical protein